jgi:hypothetical protein
VGRKYDIEKLARVKLSVYGSGAKNTRLRMLFFTEVNGYEWKDIPVTLRDRSRVNGRDRWWYEREPLAQLKGWSRQDRAGYG